MNILFFIDHDIVDEIPWHSTLSRTRGLHGETVFKLLFKKVLLMCISEGMVSGKRQAVDSAYIKANASLDSLVEKYLLSEFESEILQDGEKFANELDEKMNRKKKFPRKKRNRLNRITSGKKRNTRISSALVNKKKMATSLNSEPSIVRNF